MAQWFSKVDKVFNMASAIAIFCAVGCLCLLVAKAFRYAMGW